MHLLYVSDKGFKVVKKIREFLKSHPYVSEDSIKGTLADFIVYLRYPGQDDYSTVDRTFTSEYIAKSWKLEDLYNILMIEVKKNYSYSEDGGYVEFY